MLRRSPRQFSKDPLLHISVFLFIHLATRDIFLEKGVGVVVEFHEVIGGRISQVGTERSV
jgi:hypothetical protein